jgi:hypothetical protein
MVEYRVIPIGRVESSLKERAQAPRQGDEGAPDAVIDVKPVLDKVAER